jgi:hypothetical protein
MPSVVGELVHVVAARFYRLALALGLVSIAAIFCADTPARQHRDERQP